jgi:selenocysteine lyase/cysteine desulfurase
MDPTAAAADPSCPRMECGTSRAEEEYDTTLPTASSLATPPALADFLASVTSVEDLRRRLAMDVVTQGPTSTTFTSPFGDPTSSRQQQHALTLPLVYCDQTASNRPLQSLEDYLQKVALPLYGNTHTTTSLSGAQATALVAEARQLVAEAVNAKITGKASLDVVLFAYVTNSRWLVGLLDHPVENVHSVKCAPTSDAHTLPLFCFALFLCLVGTLSDSYSGHGTTAAVELLIDGLGLKHASERPLVFSGPYEHHSNLVPWREAGCRMVMVPESARGGVDLAALERVLQTHQAESCLKMGTFSVASNVTGQVCDGRALAALLHRYGALAFFDYATAAPYVSMDMNPPAVSSSPDDTTTNKNKNSTVASVAADAIFFSPHKCLGGVGTPGVLVCKKHLLSQTNAPGRSGGGTVFYVTHADHRFLSNRLERYEGGTPHVVGIWRAGLTMMVKRRVAQVYAQVAAAANVSHQQVPRTLVEFEYQTYQRVATYVQEHAPNLVLLGYHPARSSSQPHLPIFSFLIRCGSRFLHYNYVCAILNDVFGIQSRGGCQCAGPYSQRLLGLTTTNEEGLDMPSAVNRRLEQALLQYKERAELLRPGYSRLSLPFKGVRPEEVDYVCKAMAWVSKHAWALMCVYRCNHRTGEVCLDRNPYEIQTITFLPSSLDSGVTTIDRVSRSVGRSVVG